MSSPTTVEQIIIRGACPHDCPDTCSMLITVENGRAIEVRGNPDHPFTRGGLCVKVNNYTDRVYSPDRVLYPLRRTGPKGSRQFERISWEAALQEISSRFKQIIAEDGPQAILPCSYLGTEGILNGLNAGDAFFNKLGASISERTYCDSGACVGYIMTVGPTPGTEPESFIHSKYIILWACNTISTNLHHWPIIADMLLTLREIFRHLRESVSSLLLWQRVATLSCRYSARGPPSFSPGSLLTQCHTTFHRVSHHKPTLPKRCTTRSTCFLRSRTRFSIPAMGIYQLNKE